MKANENKNTEKTNGFMKKQKKNYCKSNPSIPNHFSLAMLSFVIIMIVISCDRKEVGVLFRDTHKYIVTKEDKTLKIVNQKGIGDDLECDTTEAFFKNGEYKFADGSLFMSTKRDTSYTKLYDNGQKQLIIIHPVNVNNKVNRYCTQILFSFSDIVGKSENKDSSSIGDDFDFNDYVGKESASIWMTQSFLYDKDYQIIEIQDMASFCPTIE